MTFLFSFQPIIIDPGTPKNRYEILYSEVRLTWNFYVSNLKHFDTFNIFIYKGSRKLVSCYNEGGALNHDYIP